VTELENLLKFMEKTLKFKKELHVIYAI